MAKISKTVTTTTRDGRTGKLVSPTKETSGASVLGETPDGVRILKPKGKPTHFSAKEIREAIMSVRNLKRDE